MEALKLSVKVKVVLKMVSWIDENIQADITSEKVTKMSGYTHWHFQKLFSSITGYKLAEYIRIRRIQSVAEALAVSHHKITHISFDHGFPTQQSLARLFKKYYDYTPSQYRRAARANPILHKKLRAKVLAKGLMD